MRNDEGTFREINFDRTLAFIKVFYRAKYSSRKKFDRCTSIFLLLLALQRTAAGLTLITHSTRFAHTMQNRSQNRMQHLYGAVLLLSLSFSASLHAAETQDSSATPPNPPAPYYAPPAPAYYPPPAPVYALRPYQTDPAFTILDALLYRPIGLATTLAGLGLFIGASPFLALASIPRPHDAFPQAFDMLITAPAAYTFARPLGERSLPYPHLQHY